MSVVYMVQKGTNQTIYQKARAYLKGVIIINMSTLQQTVKFFYNILHS